MLRNTAPNGFQKVGWADLEDCSLVFLKDVKTVLGKPTAVTSVFGPFMVQDVAERVLRTVQGYTFALQSDDDLLVRAL